MNACNITYKVRNQHYEIESVLHTSCGKIMIELVGKGNSKFVVKQQCDLSEKVIVYMDSLRVFFNEKQIKVQHRINGEHNPQMEIELKENDLWEASFQFERGVFDGDTITVFGPTYLECENHVIALDTIIYSFSNRLRIHGVNDF